VIYTTFMMQAHCSQSLSSMVPVPLRGFSLVPGLPSLTRLQMFNRVYRQEMRLDNNVHSF